MMCQICNKKEATVHFTEVMNNKSSELHLCESCAQKKGLSLQPQFSIADLLVGLINLGISPPPNKRTSLKCANCGLTYQQFSRVGRLGCGDCYQTFREALVPLLRKIHGSIQHRGHFPRHHGPGKTAPGKNKISPLEKLKGELAMAVEKEEFELAARLRDKIKALEKKEGGGK